VLNLWLRLNGAQSELTSSQTKADIKNDNPSLKLLVFLLIPALALGMSACGKRYAPGVPIQTKFAYELKQSLEKLEPVQVKVMAGVDQGAITAAQAKPFLDAVREVNVFSRDKLIPKLDAFDAAMTLGDRAKADALTIEIQPLVTEFNALIGRTFNVQLPSSFANALASVAEEVRKLLVGIRTQFAKPQAQGAYPAFAPAA